MVFVLHRKSYASRVACPALLQFICSRYGYLPLGLTSGCLTSGGVNYFRLGSQGNVAPVLARHRSLHNGSLGERNMQNNE